MERLQEAFAVIPPVMTLIGFCLGILFWLDAKPSKLDTDKKTTLIINLLICVGLMLGGISLKLFIG